MILITHLTCVSGRTLEADSLFQYELGKTHSYYQDPSIVPIFLDEIPADQLTAAQALCGTDATSIPCIFDYIATQDASFANSTLNTLNEATNNIAEAGMYDYYRNYQSKTTSLMIHELSFFFKKRNLLYLPFQQNIHPLHCLLTSNQNFRNIFLSQCG